MTAPDFIASLPRDPAKALDQLAGALNRDWCPDMPEDYRRALVTAQAEIMRGAGR